MNSQTRYVLVLRNYGCDAYDGCICIVSAKEACDCSPKVELRATL